MNQRDLSLDFVKGFLVLSMVIYHTFNYFSSAGYDALQYVRYTTGGFIFISGYLVATYYKDRFILNRKPVWIRLLTRGVKLSLIFIIVNLLIGMVGIESHKTKYDFSQQVYNLQSIFLCGNASGLAFPILVPIAYTLILSPFFIFLHKYRKYLFVFIISSLLAYVLFDLNNFLLYGMLIGITAIVFGIFTDNENKHRSIKNIPLILLLFGMCVYFMKFFDTNIITYVIGITIILKLVYDFSKTQSLANPINKIIINCGQYSLLCYLAQIFFLQIIHGLFFRHRYSFYYEILLIIIITCLFLIAICQATDYFRNKIILIDKIYKIIFS